MYLDQERNAQLYTNNAQLYTLHDDYMTFYPLSDGLWDVLSNEAAVAAMRNVFSNSSKSAADVAGDMLDIALRRGVVIQPFR